MLFRRHNKQDDSENLGMQFRIKEERTSGVTPVICNFFEHIAEIITAIPNTANPTPVVASVKSCDTAGNMVSTNNGPRIEAGLPE